MQKIQIKYYQQDIAQLSTQIVFMKKKKKKVLVYFIRLNSDLRSLLQ